MTNIQDQRKSAQWPFSPQEGDHHGVLSLFPICTHEKLSPPGLSIQLLNYILNALNEINRFYSYNWFAKCHPLVDPLWTIVTKLR